jgi:uncharacterized protein YndB with AHSA1/START domain
VRLNGMRTLLNGSTSGLVCVALALFGSLAFAAQSGWLAEPGTQQRLAEGQVVVESARESDAAAPRGQVRAAVRIAASPEDIWRVMTDCAQAPFYVPGLTRCRRVDTAPDGSWEDIEHEVRFSTLLPPIHYVFHAQYYRPYRMDFHRISGDLKEQTGTWLLTATPDGAATVVEYEVYVDPGFWIPQSLVERMLRKDVPEVLSGLRQRVAQEQHRSP